MSTYYYVFYQIITFVCYQMTNSQLLIQYLRPFFLFNSYRCQSIETKHQTPVVPLSPSRSPHHYYCDTWNPISNHTPFKSQIPNPHLKSSPSATTLLATSISLCICHPSRINWLLKALSKCGDVSFKCWL